MCGGTSCWRATVKPSWAVSQRAWARTSGTLRAKCSNFMREKLGRVRGTESSHRVDAAELRGFFHEGHRGGEIEVVELLEIDAAASGLHAAEFRGVLLGEVTAHVRRAEVEAVVILPRRETDRKPLAFAAAGGF